MPNLPPLPPLSNNGETRSLEMLAVAMSEEYDVTVVCDGQNARTAVAENGRTTITIPSIPITDRHYRALIRGYVDHEVGHLRFTDQARMTGFPLSVPQFSGALRNVAHIFEDIQIERRMGECFPGSRRNLRVMGSLLYLKHESTILPPPLESVDAASVLDALASGVLRPGDVPYRLWTAATQYMLFRVRSELSAAFKSHLTRFRAPLDMLAPGLAECLEPILARVFIEGTCTEACLNLALETITTALAHLERLAAEGTVFTEEMLPSLRWILRNGGSSQASVDMGHAVELVIEELVHDIDPRLLENTVIMRDPVGSEVWKLRISTLTEEEQYEALKASARMDAQMQALLQSFTLNRSGPMRSGRLNTNALHKLFSCRSDIFFRHVDRRGINTEVALCIDMSGSMHKDDKALLASKALFSLSRSLSRIRGLAFGLYGFFDNHVVDILRGGSRVTPHMRIVPDGGTLCGCALKAAMQTFSASPDSRKIVIMITDGDANDGDDFEKAIARARTSGVEFLGVGIRDRHILDYLPEEECCVIMDLRQLAPEILRMLRKKLNIED